MKNIEKIKQNLKTRLSEKRYIHSIGTMKMAKLLAEKYNIDPKKAELVGLVHDVGKEIPNDEKLQYAKKYNIPVDDVEKVSVGLLHAKIGAYIAKTEYGFTEEMQNAIKYHTVGNPDMDLLAKIVYIADKIEENRKFDDLEYTKNLAFDNIDKCMVYILNFSIKEKIEENKLIHINAVLTRNKLINDFNNEKDLKIT